MASTTTIGTSLDFNPKQANSRKYKELQHAEKISRVKRARKNNQVHIPPRMTSRKIYQNEGDERAIDSSIKGLIDTWIDRRSASYSDASAKMNEYCVKIGAFVANLVLCASTQQFVACSLQFLAGVASHQIVNMFTSQAPASNESAGDTLNKILEFVRNSRGNYSEMIDTPLFKFFIDIVGMSAVCGFVPHITVGECCLISKEWSKTCANTILHDFPSAILRSVEFTLEVASTLVRGGSLSTFVSGRGVLTFVARVLAREQDVKSRMLEQKHNMSVEQHLSEASCALVQLKELLACSNGAALVIATAQKAKLEQHIATVNTLIKISGFRPRPYAYLLAGPSGVGKSTLMSEINTKVGLVCDFPTKPVNIAEISEADKYDSTITGDSTVYVYDDLCQAMDLSNLAETPHTRLVRHNNTAPGMAVKADSAEKGVIPLRPKLLAMTSNTAHLQAGSQMVAPEALLRARINKAVWVTVKKKYCDSEGRMDSSKLEVGVSPHMVQEIEYTFDNGRVTTKFGTPMDFKTWLPTLLKDAQRHKAEQEALAEKHRKHSTMRVCKACCRDLEECSCKETPGQTYTNESVRAWFNPRRAAVNRVKPYMLALETLSTIGWRATFANRFEAMMSQIVTLVFWRLLVLFRSFIAFTAFSALVTMAVIFSVSNTFGAMFLIWLLYVVHLVAMRSKHLIANAMVEEFAMVKDDFGNSLGAVALGTFCDHVVLVGAFLPLVGVMRMVVRSLGYSNEGNILNVNKCTIRARREEPNEWLSAPKIVDLEASHQVQTTDFSSAQRKIMNRVCCIKGKMDGQPKQSVCFGINVYADWVVMPKHAFLAMDPTTPWDFQFDNQQFGQNRTSLIDTTTVRDVQKDHIAFRVFKFNKNGDIRDFFPDQKFNKGALCSCTIIRKIDGTMDAMKLHATYNDNIRTESNVISGLEATTPLPTRKGDCGSPWIRSSAPHVVMGLHNGRSGLEIIAETLYKHDFDFMSEVRVFTHEGKETVSIPVAALKDIPTELYGEEILTSREITPQSCMNYCTMKDGAIPLVEAYGTCAKIGFSTSTSRVIRSPISGELEAVGLPCIWGQPPMHVKRNHEEVFKIAQHPIDSIAGPTMKWAKDDYLSEVLAEMTRIGYTSQPLDDSEIYNGRKEECINPMNMKTSSGIGLPGCKYEHFECEMRNTGKHYTPKPYVSQEVSRLRGLAISGQRTCPISKTAIKDEPTKLTKDVARLFYVMPLAFIAITRQVLCPILAYMMATPLTSESWFGIHVTKDEWGQCYEYLNRFRNNIAMNGDYSKYDLHFSSQLIFSVGEIFANMGQCLGYPPWAIAMIASVFSDLSNPLYAYSGTLVSFLGLMPSGNPATVAINGVGNSLLHRCFFYEYWKRQYQSEPPVGVFRKYCTMGFVGDDSIGGVSSEIPWFNMQNYQSWLARIGMPYTPADKEADMPLYVPLKKASLCKRMFVEMEEGIVDAPIEIASILKSMHMLHTSKGDQEMITSLNVTQGLRELARWPKEVFDKYQPLIRDACANAMIPVKDITRSYESWRIEIVAAYHSAPVPEVRVDPNVIQPMFDHDIYTIVE